MELKGTTHMSHISWPEGRKRRNSIVYSSQELIHMQNLEQKRRAMANFMELCMESENVTAKAGTKPVKFMPHKIMVPMKIAMFILPFGDKPIRLCWSDLPCGLPSVVFKRWHEKLRKWRCKWCKMENPRQLGRKLSCLDSKLCSIPGKPCASMDFRFPRFFHWKCSTLEKLKLIILLAGWTPEWQLISHNMPPYATQRNTMIILSDRLSCVWL